MGRKRHIVRQVAEGSIAEELEIEAGDEVLKVNNESIVDVFDYQYLIQDDYIELLVRKANGEEWILEIEKDPEEDLGIDFENSLMDEYRSCHNNCIFCFIDQMPPGMRETLYFKDDDTRLSFLQGNYVTLTNMKDKDLDRIIKYHLSPINVSVHTVNPDLRCKMLNNRFAGDLMKKLNKLSDAGIIMNGQIVLCKGINDGPELDRSIRELSALMPYMESMSVVPVGLTKYRDGLQKLEAFDQESASEVIDLIEKWQKEIYARTGSHFVHASDEWYLLAGRSLPEENRYDGYVQLENGVGMMRLLSDEVDLYLSEHEGDDRTREISVATGRLAAAFIERQMEKIKKKYPNISYQVFPIINEFFGEKITVSGLITGRDLKRQLKGQQLGKRLLLPCNMLRQGESVFLDDVLVDELEDFLETSIFVTDTKGEDFCKAVLDEDAQMTHRRRQMYEKTDCSNCRTT